MNKLKKNFSVMALLFLAVVGISTKAQAQAYYVYNLSEGISVGGWRTIYSVFNPTAQETLFYFQANGVNGAAFKQYYRIPPQNIPGYFEPARGVGEFGGTLISLVPLQLRRLVYHNNILMSDVYSQAAGAATHNFRGACSFPGAVVGYISLMNVGASESSVWIKTNYGNWENIIVPPGTRRTYGTHDLSGYYAFSSNGQVVMEEAVYNSNYTQGKVCQH